MKFTPLIFLMLMLASCASAPAPAGPPLPPAPKPARKTASMKDVLAPEATTVVLPPTFSTNHVFGITYYTTNVLPAREWINGEMLPPITGHSKPLEIVSSGHHTVVVYWQPPPTFTWQTSKDLITWNTVTTVTNAGGDGAVLIDLNAGYWAPRTFYKITN